MKVCKGAASTIVIVGAVLLSLPAVRAGDKVNQVTTVPVPDNGRPMAAKLDAAGTIHLLYDTKDGPQYVRSLDRGKTFSAAVPVVDKESRKEGLEFHS